MRNRIVIFFCVWLSFPLAFMAQEKPEENIFVSDTLVVEAPDSVTQAILTAAEEDIRQLTPNKSSFKPNPTRAMLYGLIPGMGQIYNRKFWKVPIVYGAFLGCTYAITWNQMMYGDYQTAYKDYMEDSTSGKPAEEWHTSWQMFVPANSSPEAEINNTSFRDNTLKRRKDYYRRYRDLSIIISAGVYLISLLDAYVDAQLFDFDISPDLSMRVEPVVTPKTPYSSQSYGVNCSFKF
ncbi:DUF5683 domain-containing protein [Parabacteroides sp. OttesenSCG-928-O15]|nr:DUF5683 domain-containing protein [Parabacteroides sp. OttesenSCG-928-O15]